MCNTDNLKIGMRVLCSDRRGFKYIGRVCKVRESDADVTIDKVLSLGRYSDTHPIYYIRLDSRRAHLLVFEIGGNPFTYLRRGMLGQPDRRDVLPNSHNGIDEILGMCTAVVAHRKKKGLSL